MGVTLPTDLKVSNWGWLSREIERLVKFDVFSVCLPMNIYVFIFLIPALFGLSDLKYYNHHRTVKKGLKSIAEEIVEEKRENQNIKACQIIFLKKKMVWKQESSPAVLLLPQHVAILRDIQDLMSFRIHLSQWLYCVFEYFLFIICEEFSSLLLRVP